MIQVKKQIFLFKKTVRCDFPHIYCKEDPIYVFPEMKLRVLDPSFHIHLCVSDLSIPTSGPPILLQKIGGLIVGIYKSLTDT
jgi:hypothetical protein